MYHSGLTFLWHTRKVRPETPEVGPGAQEFQYGQVGHGT